MSLEPRKRQKPFRLHALNLRFAVSELMKRFPLEQEHMPMGLELLFQMLERLGLDEVVAYGEMLEKREVDLLSGHFDRTKNTRVLLGIAQILASRQDHRALGAIRRWLHYLPPNPELNYLRQVWNPRGFRELFAGELPWLHRLMAVRGQAMVPFFIDAIHQGQLLLPDLVMGMPEEVTPLLLAMETELFTKGGPGIKQISPARAHRLAEEFLKKGRDDAVRNYFIHCPESNWPPPLVRMVYEKKGAPNRRQNAFYEGLPKGVMWGLRRLLFEELIAEGGLDHRRTIFWKRYLHHAQDAYWQGATLVLHVRPMRIIERKEHSEIVLGKEHRNPQIIVLGPMWEQEMKALLNDYIQWGQAT